MSGVATTTGATGASSETPFHHATRVSLRR